MNKFKTIGQHKNTSSAMFAVLHALVGSPKSLEKFRKANGSVRDVESNQWIDSNIVHDTINVYEKATHELNQWGYIS